MRVIFVIFLLLAILEMWVLIQVGTQIGSLNTLLAIIATAVIGMVLLKRQGLDMLARVRDKLSSGQLPAREVMEGIVLAIGGFLLIMPGFLTDIVGFLCLLPIVRRGIVRVSPFHKSSPSSPFRQPASNDSRCESRVIEGEFEKDDR